MAKDYRDGSRITRYSTDVVVALEHVDEVAGTLERLDVRFSKVKRSPALGLALLPDVDVGDGTAKVKQELERLGRSPDAGSHPGTDVDDFLRALRDYFGARYAGWTPTLGKNRDVARVVGAGGDLDGKISHGGGGTPRAAAEPAWARKRRSADKGRGVRVGVLDTSIAAHPWLAGGWVAPASDVLSPADSYQPAAGHATFLAGLVLQQAPGATVVARRVLSDEEGAANSWTVAEEIVQLARAGVDILNLSFLCYTEDGQPPLLLASAIDRLGPDVVVVAAAGNHGDLKDVDPDERRKPAWPAALDHVVAVGAADADGNPAPFSPQDAPWVDVVVPGVGLVSTYLDGSVPAAEPEGRPFGGFAEWDGTSFAAASLSGAIAARTVPGSVSARQAWSALCPKPTRPAPFLRLRQSRPGASRKAQ
jgi:membrane-anchored mycosin MYCP